MSDTMSGMEIPSNSEICIYMAFLVKSLKAERARTNDKEFSAIYDRAEDVLNRLMSASDQDSDTPPSWVSLASCDACAGVVMEAKLNSNAIVQVIPKSIDFHSTKAELYSGSLNIEFDNMRVIVGHGQSRRRWLTHGIICGKSISEVQELLKPLWLATYKPLDVSKSTGLLRDLID